MFNFEINLCLHFISIYASFSSCSYLPLCFYGQFKIGGQSSIHHSLKPLIQFKKNFMMILLKTFLTAQLHNEKQFCWNWFSYFLQKGNKMSPMSLINSFQSYFCFVFRSLFHSVIIFCLLEVIFCSHIPVCTICLVAFKFLYQYLQLIRQNWELILKWIVFFQYNPPLLSLQITYYLSLENWAVKLKRIDHNLIQVQIKFFILNKFD